MMRDCPSQRAYIATDDGEYVSTSDVEDNNEGDQATDSDTEEILGAAATDHYRALIVQWVLSTQIEQAQELQRHNLFQIYFVVQDRRVRVIIDGGSCNNLVSSDLVKKLGLATRTHPHPYHVQWFNNSGKVKVTHTAWIPFFIGSYHDCADFDVVPMQACSLLLGRPWEFDTDATLHGRSNKYTLMHKGKKITLLPMTPTEIAQCEKESAETGKTSSSLQSESQQVTIYPPNKEKKEGIKLGIIWSMPLQFWEIGNHV